MNAGHPKEDSIFDIARRIDDSSLRADYVEQACADDVNLKTRILELLKLEQDDDSFFEGPPVGASSVDARSHAPEYVNEQIGPYRLREKIGEGGMGVVYVAEQTEPVQRKVALKIIKPGMDTKEVIARFEAERQALAFMEHPNIARVFDAGATESGRSYFVMELVRGIPITEYCDQVKMSPRERLELFISVCDAVQHAHQKGIIHRDIKPSNVLVTQADGKPVVKVIDFGLAKAVSGQRLTERTLYSGFMRLMGTPVYMSPEQAGLSSQDVDTRSDTYSLGVLLFELLTGTTPLDKTDVQKRTYDELCRQIRETEAPKPSTRFSTLKAVERSSVAQLRQVDEKSLRQLLNGDLDRVVLIALDKDRNRRYGSPTELASDISRFLDNKPVTAIPPSTWYLARKYMRRNAGIFVTAAAILLLLVLATTFSSWQAIRATRARNTAELQTDAAKESEHRAVQAQRETQTALLKSDRSERKAIEARNRAENIAEQQRRQLYASDMQLADQLWNLPDGSPIRIQELLTKWIPVNGKPDLREFAWRYHWSRLHLAAEKTVTGTRDVSISPAGNLIVADETGIREWSDLKRQFVTRWTGHLFGTLQQCALSSCGRWAAVCKDEMIHFIDLQTGDVFRKVEGNLAQFATGGDYALIWRHDWRTSKSDGFVMYNVETGERRQLDHNFRQHRRIVAIAPDGKSYSLMGPHSAMEVYLPGSTTSFGLVGDGFESSAWSPDGKLFATGHYVGDVLIRNIDNLKDPIFIHTGQRAITSITFSPNSQQIALGGNGIVEIYDISHIPWRSTTASEASRTSHSNVSSGVNEPRRIASIRAHVSLINKLVYSSDGRSLATHDLNGTAKLWRLDKQPNAYPTVDPLVFPHGAAAGMGVGDVDGQVHVLNAARRTEDDRAFSQQAIRKGDRILAVEDTNGLLEVGPGVDAMDIRNSLYGEPNSIVNLHIADDQASNKRRIVKRERVPLNQTTFNSLSFTSREDEIILGADVGTFSRSIEQGTINRFFPAFSWDSRVHAKSNLLAFVVNRDLILWDLEGDREHSRVPAGSGAHPRPRFGHSGTVCFSPDGQYVAVGTGYRFRGDYEGRSDLRVWDIHNRIQIRAPLLENNSVVGAVAFSRDGEFLIAADHAGALRIWRTSDWELENTFQGLKNTLTVAFSPDGKLVAQGANSGVIVWNLESRKKHHFFREPTISSVRFTPDGTLLASMFGGKFMMWDVDVGRQLAATDLNSGILVDCELSSDGTKLGVLGRDGDLWLWDVPNLTEIDRHPLAIRALNEQACSLIEDEKPDEAASTLRWALRRRRESPPPANSELKKTRSKLVEALKLQGTYPKIANQLRSQRVNIGDGVELRVEVANDTSNEFEYQWFFAGDPIESETGATYSIRSVSESDLGRYHVEARLPDLPSVALPSEGAFLVGPNGIAKGGLRADVFLNIPKTTTYSLSPLTDLPRFPNEPDRSESIGSFELPANAGDEYGVRITGFLVPPKAGDYIFHVVSDDSSRLFLSTNASPENKQMIAELNGWRGARQWETIPPESVSEPQTLQAGKRYWIEAWYREQKSNDHFAVTWQMPGEPPPKNGDPPISGEFLEHQVD